MDVSGGRWVVKAAISGALQEVWPPTMAPSLVARDFDVSVGREG